MKRLLFLSILSATIFLSCDTETKVNELDDPAMRMIADLQDRRLTDSLYQYFDSESATHRARAASAFGSIQDTTAVPRLARLLADSDSNVRIAAAFALGQTRSGASADALLDALSNESNTRARHVILEALGKTSAGSDIFKRDEVNRSGIAAALYRLGLRNKANPGLNELAVSLLAPQETEATRLMAAHFFARSATDIEKWYGQIASAATRDSSVNVRMAAAYALRKVRTDSSFHTLQALINTKDDYRVKVNAIRALGSFPYEKIKPVLFGQLTDKNEHVAVAATEVIVSTATAEAWIELSNIASRVPYWRSQANIYRAALKGRDYDGTINEIKSLYAKSKNPYQRAALLSCLQEAPDSYSFIHGELMKADTPVIRSTAAAALVGINQGKRFRQGLKSIFLNLYKEAIHTEDPAVIGIVAGALADPALGYREIIRDASFLYDAKARLSLPKDNEALQPLEAAIAHVEGRDANAVSNQYNNPIDWTLVQRIPSEAKAVIRTSRGHIVIRLLVDEAPGSVANFVRLAASGYFDRKLFHRVVPNFVIQAGCNRGDGWGSEDYSIRSEFSGRRYTTGSVGMASAGKDTEGTQWFITHSPTPHLDGNYSIFAEVEKGMEVVHLIQVGDAILGVDLPFLNHDGQ